MFLVGVYLIISNDIFIYLMKRKRKKGNLHNANSIAKVETLSD